MRGKCMKAYTFLAVLGLCGLLVGCKTQSVTTTVDGDSGRTVSTSKASNIPDPYDSENRDKIAAGINARLAMGYMREGNMPLAKQKLLTALDQAPKDPIILDAMAYYQEQTGNDQEAQRYYQKAISVSPKSGAALNNYGTYLCRQGQYAPSVNYFVRAANDPTYLDVANAFENAGVCSMQIPNEKQAAFYFQRALQNNPNLQDSLVSMAQISLKEKQYKAADGYLQRLNKITPASAQSLWLEIQAAHALGDKDTVASAAMALQNQFPNSKEYGAYTKSGIS